MIIKKVSKYPGVFIFKNLSNNYFNYLDNCLFVIGNTSSGIFDAPYFNKVFINIGYRQEGRKTDTNVFSTGTNFFKIKKYIDRFQYEYKAANNKIFGDKNSLDIQIKHILRFCKKN
jgi:UDP-N-acetylglucosamine 2-epimerase